MFFLALSAALSRTRWAVGRRRAPLALARNSRAPESVAHVRPVQYSWCIQARGLAGGSLATYVLGLHVALAESLGWLHGALLQWACMRGGVPQGGGPTRLLRNRTHERGAAFLDRSPVSERRQGNLVCGPPMEAGNVRGVQGSGPEPNMRSPPREASLRAP